MSFIDSLRNRISGNNEEVEKDEEKNKNPSRDIEEKARNLLEKPDLLYQVKRVLDQGFVVDKYRAIVGEDKNKLLTFLIGLSAKTDYPQFEWVKGTSGKGKTNLVSTVMHLFPEDYVKKMAHFTKGALRHGDDDYNILYLQEWKNDAEQDLRLISSQDGGYSFEIAVKKGGEWKTKEKTIPAKTLITTSVKFNATNQMDRRCWKLSVDESQKLTDRINKKKAEYHQGNVNPISEEKLQVIGKAINLLESREVVIPYADKINDLVKWDRTHQDFFYELVKVICILHQRQRHVDREEKLVAAPEDYYHALQIVWPDILIELLSNIPNRLKKYIDKLEECGKSSATDLAEEMNKSESTIRGDISQLEEYGFVSKEWDGGSKSYVLKSARQVIQHLKWDKIASMVRRRQYSPFSEGVEKNSDIEEEGVIDPITGENYRLSTMDDDTSGQIVGEEENSPKNRMRESGDEDILQPDRTFPLGGWEKNHQQAR